MFIVTIPKSDNICSIFSLCESRAPNQTTIQNSITGNMNYPIATFYDILTSNRSIYTGH